MYIQLLENSRIHKHEFMLVLLAFNIAKRLISDGLIKRINPYINTPTPTAWPRTAQRIYVQ